MNIDAKISHILNCDKDYIINKKYYQFNKHSNKKYIYAQPRQKTYQSWPVYDAYEIQLTKSEDAKFKGIILDFDCTDKQSQAKEIASIMCHLKEIFSQFYKEMTVNGGVHILIPFDCVYSLTDENMKFYISETLCIEFKTTCLIFPSSNYNVIEPVPSVAFKISPAILESLLIELCIKIAAPNVKDLVSKMLSAHEYFLYFGTLDEISIFDSQDHITNSNIRDDASVHLEVSSTPSRDGGSDSEDNTSVFDKPRSARPKKRIAIVKPECVAQSNKKPKRDVFFESVNATINSCLQSSGLGAPIEEKSDIGETYVNAMIEKLGKEWVYNIYTCAIKSIGLSDPAIDLSDVINFEDIFTDSVTQAGDEEAQDNSRGALPYIFFANTNSCKQVCAKIKTNLIKLKQCQFSLFQVFLFLKYLELADATREFENAGSPLAAHIDGVYSSHKDFKKWSQFVKAYCKIIRIFKRRGFLSSGRYSVSEFLDFKLYRYVTLKNEIGGRMSDNDALNEYRKFYEKYDNFSMADSNLSTVFFEFILSTLCTVILDTHTISALVLYNDYVLDAQNLAITKKMFYCKTFFDIYLKNVKFHVEGIRCDVKNAQVSLSAPTLLYINNLPWIEIGNCNIFTAFIKKCFPDSDELKPILDSIASVAVAENLTANIKTWNNLWPFSNGVLDFRPHNPKNITRGVCSNIKSSNEPSSVKADRNKFQSETTIQRDCQSIFSQDDLCIQTIKLNCARPNTININPVFRNYTQVDSVVSPIDRRFNMEEYMSTFDTTPLLSLENDTRYSNQFCLFFRSLLGASAANGEMGPYQYLNMMGLFLNLAFGSFRDKEAQTGIYLYGGGSNGKSQLLKLICDTFTPEKCVRMSTNLFYSNTDINMQKDGIEEALFLYDNEAPGEISDVSKFKDEISDITPNVSRAIYKPINRKAYNLAGQLFASNRIMRARQLNPYEFDFAFARRIYFTHFENTFKNIKRGEDSEHGGTQTNQPRTSTTPRQTKCNVLFSNKYNLNEKGNTDAICRGILYYLLDCIHVFNLCGLHSDHKRVMSTNFYARKFARENYAILDHLMKEYAFLNELYTPANAQNKEPDNISLEELINDVKMKQDKTQQNVKFESVAVIKTNLKALGVKFSESGGFGDSPYNIITGLIKRTQLRQRDMVMLQHPSCSIYELWNKNQTDGSLIENNIPHDHLLNFESNDLKKKVYNVVNNVLLKKQISSQIRPMVDPNFICVEKADLFNLLY